MKDKIQPIIKLRKNVKFPKNLGISLRHLTSTPRTDSLQTASTLSFGGVWFNLKGQQVLFKTFNYNPVEGLKEFRQMNEIICYELAKQLKIPCVHYEFAHLKKSTGVITYNALRENQELITGNDILKDSYENLFANYVSSLFDYMSIHNYDADTNKIINHLYKIAVFDLLTFQTDRHKTNINFIIEDKKTLKPFPLFDNEYAFGTKIFYDYLLKNQNESQSISMSTKDFIEQYNEVACKICFNIRNYQDYIANVNSAVYLATRQNDYATFLKNAIKNLDIEKCLQTLKSKGCKFSREQEDIYRNCINLSKKIFLNEMTKQNLISIPKQMENNIEYEY